MLAKLPWWEDIYFFIYWIEGIYFKSTSQPYPLDFVWILNNNFKPAKTSTTYCISFIASSFSVFIQYFVFPPTFPHSLLCFCWKYSPKLLPLVFLLFKISIWSRVVGNSREICERATNLSLMLGLGFWIPNLFVHIYQYLFFYDFDSI